MNQELTFKTEFTGPAQNRARFWSRALIGFSTLVKAKPNRFHFYTAQLERQGVFTGIITQNVDRLHVEAGAKQVVELHGRGDLLHCTTCGHEANRVEYQNELKKVNKVWMDRVLGLKEYKLSPDGDAELGVVDLSDFHILPCLRCGTGFYKPAYVFFGGTIPPDVAQNAENMIRNSQGLIVAGTTATTWSAYRLVKLAKELNLPVALLNQGPTRCDGLVDFKIDDVSCGDALQSAVMEEEEEGFVKATPAEQSSAVAFGR